MRAIRAGAPGCLNKESTREQLVTALRKIAGGSVHVSAAVAEALFNNVRGNTSVTLHERLSDREFQVLRMIAIGKSVTDIASALNLSPKTVSTHKTRILDKMKMSNQAELIRYAIEHRLVDAGPEQA